MSHLMRFQLQLIQKNKSHTLATILNTNGNGNK